MKATTLVRRGLVFHARAHAATLAGVAVASAVLTGALAVGDSVRASLRRAAELRLGRIDAVLGSGERFFGIDLSARLAERVPGLESAPVIQLGAVVASADGTRRVADVQLLGVEPDFFALAPSGRGPALAGEQAWIGGELARTLGAASGDELVLRTVRPSAMTRELALASVEESIQPLRVTVAGLLEDEDFGLFALEAGAGPRANLFVSRSWLARALAVEARANRCFLNLGSSDTPLPAVERALRASWQPADVGLAWHERPGAEELRSDQVFLHDALVSALAGAEPPPLGILTYFVNELRHGERATPYSTVAALGAPSAGPAPDLGGWRARVPELGRDGIAINAWLADDLAAGAGDEIELSYYVLGSGRSLIEQRHAFRVQSIVPTEGWGADPTLMPDFPGIGDAENCRDWDPGMPVELGRIRDRDEQYWDAHRGAPKAFVSLVTARELWANRFGSLTALRVAPGGSAQALARLRELPPGQLGLPLRAASARVEGTSDFGALFVGLSMFLVVSALLLTALFFAFSVERRASELGILRVSGFLPQEVVRLLMSEALLLCLLGALLGGALGVGYTRVLVHALEHEWRAAVGRLELVFHVEITTLVLGAGLSLLLGLGAARLVLRRAFRTRPLELLWGGLAREAALASSRRRRMLILLLALVGLGCLVAALAAQGSGAAAPAFAGGLVLLCCGVVLVRECLAGPAPSARTLLALGWSGAARNPWRSVATVALVAGSVFLLVVAGSNRQAPEPSESGPDSGTGGFAFLGRTSLAVLQDLETQAGREFYGLTEDELAGARIVPLRVRAGDEASCLNLDRPRQPRLLGVRPARLAGCFRFAATLTRSDDPWALLDQDLGPDVVPAIVDATSLQWTLHQKLGDELELVDGRGQPFRARVVATLADSILQGDVLLAEPAFEARFPDQAGHQAFLIGAPLERRAALAARLTRALADEGLVLTPAHERLDLLHGVQNSYLAIFQVLGGLGLALGSAGLLALVLRHAIERAGELALFCALGFTRGELRWLFLGEQGALVWIGLVLGSVSGASVVLGTGSLDALRTTAPWVGAVGVLGVLWVWLGTFAALRGPLLGALNRE